MTKKHFDALAAAIAGMHANDRYAAAIAIGRVCARFNPSFDDARWLAACGINIPAGWDKVEA